MANIGTLTTLYDGGGPYTKTPNPITYDYPIDIVGERLQANGIYPFAQIYVEAATPSLKFTVSATEGGTHAYADSVTALLTFTPDGYESGRDSGTIAFKLTPSVVEARTITDASTLSFKLTPGGSDTYLPGLPAAEDIGTIFLDLQPSGIVLVEYIDAGSYALKFTVATAHECIAHNRPQFTAETYQHWQSIAYYNWYVQDETNRWAGEITMLPVPDPC